MFFEEAKVHLEPESSGGDIPFIAKDFSGSATTYQVMARFYLLFISLLYYLAASASIQDLHRPQRKIGKLAPLFTAFSWIIAVDSQQDLQRISHKAPALFKRGVVVISWLSFHFPTLPSLHW